jgi:hypothetical protein
LGPSGVLFVFYKQPATAASSAHVKAGVFPSFIFSVSLLLSCYFSNLSVEFFSEPFALVMTSGQAEFVRRFD